MAIASFLVRFQLLNDALLMGLQNIVGMWRSCSGGFLLHNKVVLRCKIGSFCGVNADKKIKPAIERVQALTDISCSALCCYSNEARTRTANPANSAQLEGTPYYSPNLHPGPCSSVEVRRLSVSVCLCAIGEEQTHRQTDRHTDTQTAVTNIHFASATPHA